MLIGDCMVHLNASGLKEAVFYVRLQINPCLPSVSACRCFLKQAMRGGSAALGLFKGKVIRFPEAALVTAQGTRLKVPQMGWNTVTQRMDHPVWQGIKNGAWFYFLSTATLFVPKTTRSRRGRRVTGFLSCARRGAMTTFLPRSFTRKVLPT